ncbi:cytochrome P450 [Jejudonia soesokkakensis]|uniref:Cytochrome P450 n=1 Tax=Jejudonia soesokkakensis TaxID=1323432 RepID=A0ABW2MSQ4_9FLAO
MDNQKIPKVSIFKFLGHARNILKNPLPFHHRNFSEKGDTFRLQLGIRTSVIFSRDAGFLQYVLQKNQKNYTKSTIQTVDLAKYVGRGLLTAEGSHWQKQRKMIQPAFHKKQLVNLLEAMQNAIDVEIAKIETHKAIDIFPIFNDLAFQTVAKALFSGGVTASETNRLQYITETAQKMLVKELRQPFKIWWFKLSGKIKKHMDLVDEARAILKQLVTRRIESGKREDDLLDMLLDARYEDGTAMSEKQLLDEILILFTAGHETTSNALTFTAELLARHPEIQDKVFQEVFEAQPIKEDLMSFLKVCPYTKQVIEESMRLYPPAYFIDRVNHEADSFNEMEIEKGATLLFSLHEIHRDPRFWNEPDTFDPGRFAASNGLKYSEYYYPFGAGPRMCIGNNFAMYEMVLAIASLIFKFKIEEKKSPINITPLITMKPKDAILRFEMRS